MTTRINQQPENKILEDTRNIGVTLRELKTGRQYTEARMYEYSSAIAYDLTGALAASAGGNQPLATLIVTATSTDSGSFLSAFTPEVWIPNMSTPYRDNFSGNYQILYNKLITDDPMVMQYWFTIGARNAVSASTFYFKARIYSTAPVSVTYARIV
jgi:hypothetical protein